MNKKYLSALLFGALTLASTGTFTSCKDYDDDIENLQSQIGSLKELTEGLQAQIQQGKLIKSVTPTGNGIVIEMSDGQQFEINNGKNGADAPATVVEIGKNGNWFINGEDTGKPSQGAKGDKGDQGEQGKPGQPGEGGASASSKYYKPGTDGYWYVVENGKETKTDMKWETAASQAGGIVAIKSGDALTLKNVQGAEGGMVTIGLSAELKSMVFIPEFSLEGHEAMEYIYIPYRKHTAGKTKVAKNLVVWSSENCAVAKATEPYSIDPEFAIALKHSFVFPFNNQNFHLNPDNAYLAETTPVDMSSDDLDVEYTRSTGASANKAASKPVGKYVARANGDLTIGISMIGNLVKSQYEYDATKATAWNKAKYATYFADVKNTEDAMTQLAPSIKVGELDVTSTYAAVKASQFAVAELAYNAKNTPVHAIDKFHFENEETYWAGKGLLKDYTKHETPINGGAHLYSTIQEAAEKPATIELVYTNDNGINLNELIDVHFISNSGRKWNAGKVHARHTTAELAYYDLHLEFNLANFTVGSNKTAQNAFAIIKKAPKGTDMMIYPCDVLSKSDTDQSKWQADESTIGRGIAGVGKTPVVVVKLVNKAGEIVKVGYIKMKITAPLNPLQTEPFKLEDFFYKCSTAKSTIAWHAISNKLFSAALPGGSNVIKDKAMFDRHYEVVKTTTGEVAQFYNTGKKDKNGKPIYAEHPATAYLGTITELPNSGAETTDVFEWSFTRPEFQYVYTYFKGVGYPVFNIERLVKYEPTAETDGDATFSKEPIYLPLQTTLYMPKGIMSNKLDKYWFADNSNDQLGVELAKRNNVHVHVQVPNAVIEGETSTAETPFIKMDLNSAFHKNLGGTAYNNGIGYPRANQNVSWSVSTPIWYNSTDWVAENAPIIDFINAAPWNTAWNNAKNFGDFTSHNLVYYYYFTAANNKKVVKGIDGKDHTLTVTNTLAHKPIMMYGDAKYEYLNSELNCDGVKILSITHDDKSPMGTGQIAQAVLNLEHNTQAELVLNNPKVWNAVQHNDVTMLKEALDIEIGVVAFNKPCGLYLPLENNTFTAEILKPVYERAGKQFVYTDAKDADKNVEYLFDHVEFNDWRRLDFADNLSYYNFYGVESMKVNVDEIRTDISGVMKPLKETSGDVPFYFEPGANKVLPATATLKDLRENFGKLRYNDVNGSIVNEFNFEVPVHIKHYWTKDIDVVVWVSGSKVLKTLGNE